MYYNVMAFRRVKVEVEACLGTILIGACVYIIDIVDDVPCFSVAFSARHCCQVCSCRSGISRSYLSRLVWSHGFVRALPGTHTNNIVPVSSSMHGVLVRTLRGFPVGPGSRSNLSGSPRLAWGLCSCLRCRFLSHTVVASMAVWERYYRMM